MFSFERMDLICPWRIKSQICDQGDQLNYTIYIFEVQICIEITARIHVCDVMNVCFWIEIEEMIDGILKNKTNNSLKLRSEIK